jgi:hypothetical protein
MWQWRKKQHAQQRQHAQYCDNLDGPINRTEEHVKVAPYGSMALLINSTEAFYIAMRHISAAAVANELFVLRRLTGKRRSGVGSRTSWHDARRVSPVTQERSTPLTEKLRRKRPSYSEAVGRLFAGHRPNARRGADRARKREPCATPCDASRAVSAARPRRTIGRRPLVTVVITILSPLPDISHHVIEIECVSRK